MIKLILAMLMMFNLVPQAIPPEVTIDRIEDNNIAVIEVCYKDNITMVDVPEEDFNETIKEGTKLSASVAIGSFYGCDDDEWYQFKSYDDAEWWVLTTEDIGFTPEPTKTYTLIYYDNGTTDCTECDESLECECEVYDDIFLTIVSK